MTAFAFGTIKFVFSRSYLENCRKNQKKIGKLFKKMAKVGSQVAVSAVGVDGGAVGDFFEGEESPQSDISQLKDEIESLIADPLEHNPTKKGFTFYIDDLDRIDPPVAVEILELLKNLLDWLSRSMDMSVFQNPSAALGKKVAISGAGGKNMTQSCRAKLTELLDFMKMDPMHELQTGIVHGIETWTQGEFFLTDEQRADLQKQADAFCSFIE